MPDGNNDAFDAAALARTGIETKELRQECPRHILNVLDAVSLARDQTRTALVVEILGKWAEKQVHESMLIQRIAGGNPTGSESRGAQA